MVESETNEEVMLLVIILIEKLLQIKTESKVDLLLLVIILLFCERS